MTRAAHDPSAQIADGGRTRDGRRVAMAILENGAGLRAEILSFGGILSRLEVGDASGSRTNVVLGLPCLEAYEDQDTYFGAIIGRYANRIRHGTFTLDGVHHEATVNDPFGSVHGGAAGFDKRLWRMSLLRAPRIGVRLHRVSRDGEEGFPGNLRVTVTYQLRSNPDCLRIDYRATTDAPTLVNLTNHSYVNLAGEGSGSVLGHSLRIGADHFLPVDDCLVPTGVIQPVDGTPFDFRVPRVIEERIREGHEQLRRGKGYDHTYVLSTTADGRFRRAATVADPASGRQLDLWTTEPGLDVYTGNLLDGSAVGSSGRIYRQGDGLALEPQHFCDSPHRPAFPSTVLRPGERYTSTTEYRFSSLPAGEGHAAAQGSGCP